jgi:hypothetical protein
MKQNATKSPCEVASNMPVTLALINGFGDLFGDWTGGASFFHIFCGSS